MAQIYCTRKILASNDEVFNFMVDPDNFAEMLKKDIDIEVLNRPEDITFDSEFELQMTRYGLSQKVRLRVMELEFGVRVAYKQVEGLFERWNHTQVFEAAESGHTQVTDVVDYEMPLSFFGHVLSDLIVKKDMTRVLEHRLDEVQKYFKFNNSEKDLGL